LKMKNIGNIILGINLGFTTSIVLIKLIKKRL